MGGNVISRVIPGGVAANVSPRVSRQYSVPTYAPMTTRSNFYAPTHTVQRVCSNGVCQNTYLQDEIVHQVVEVPQMFETVREVEVPQIHTVERLVHAPRIQTQDRY